MISVEAAKAIIKDCTIKAPIVKISLVEALGLTLGEPVYAAIDIPAFTQSSMDGYALKFSDLRELELAGEMQAGATAIQKMEPYQATRIFTGAPLPEGADTVIMQEKVKREGGQLLLLDDQLRMGTNVRPIGAEAKKGELAMDAGTYLSPAAIGFLAGIGLTEVPVYQPLQVTIILTGNELQDPGKPLAFGQVYEANSVMLKAALQQAQVKQVKVLKAVDKLDELISVLQTSLLISDMVLLTGGVSVGDYDFVVAATAACGITQQFHKIRQKPGKPLFFGTKGRQLVFGLPGNPSSVLTCFYEYVLPALAATGQQLQEVKQITATLTNNYKKTMGLTHFIKASYQNGQVTPLPAQESFRLHSFAQANAFIVLKEEQTEVVAGEIVDVHLLPL
ncbi:molybdopterin molybdotransferase [Pedobacter sp. CAN_A7]|uniref:molybdopterin molybdotransferase MoeA n=1 Tax=Pedobacter sp. CAN_A7 TaxID=2787722 RepID=UPI0018CBDA57